MTAIKILIICSEMQDFLPPCHFYHVSQCYLKGCKYSHAGSPLGYCMNLECPICLKHKSAPHASRERLLHCSSRAAGAGPVDV